MPSWLAVARNEYRLMMSGKVTRRLRRVLPILLVSAVAAMAMALPLASRSLFLEFRIRGYLEDTLTLPLKLDPALLFFAVDTSYAWKMGALTGTLAFLIPIFAAIGRQLEEVEVVSKDMVLSSPLKPVHVLVGEFIVNLLMLPVILLVSTFMFIPVALSLYLTFQAVALIFVALTLASLTGIWVAVLISTYLFTCEPMGKVKSALKALLVILGVAMGTGIITLSTSTSAMPSGLWFLPPVWVASVIHFAVAQSNIAVVKLGFAYFLVPVQPDGWTGFTLLLALFAFSFIVGAAYLSRIKFTSIVEGKEETLIIKKENVFYRTIRKAFPSPLNVMVVSQLKEFTRKTDNVTRFASIIIFPLVILFMNRMMQSDVTSGELSMLFLSSFSGFYFVLAGVALPLMIIPYIFVDSKDILWMIKKTPKGTRLLVYSMLAEALILSVPMSIVLALLFYLAMGGIGNPAPLLAVLLFMVCVSTSIAVGVYASRPIFKEKGFGHFVNFTITFIATGIVVSAMLVLLVTPWVLNLIAIAPLLQAVSWLPQPTSIVIRQTLTYVATSVTPVDVPLQVTGTAASIILGAISIYISVKRSVRKLELYEG
ncbi:MAG: hypothetical protein KIH01_01725 [Candidatus Freyarchaeota archaeon]|nr:hypothetical protein [Candidatus Jordarchaeia archaeon]